MVEEIKKLLEPHYGHLDFLLKIKKDEISIEDISNLIEMINDKNLVSNLPKELHKYGSYYTLAKDLYFTKENLVLLKEIKSNLTLTPKSIVLSLITEDDSVKKDLFKIIANEELKSTFYRWSSRIKDKEFAKNYIKAVISDTDILNRLNGEKSDLIELKNFKDHSKYIPSSWCIKNEGTFYNYLRTQRIFILKYQHKIYGVNFYNNSMLGNISIMNSKNSPVNPFTEEKIFSKAKSEILKYDIFGCSDKIKSEDLSETEKKEMWLGLSAVDAFHHGFPIMDHVNVPVRLVDGERDPQKKSFIKRIFQK